MLDSSIWHVLSRSITDQYPLLVVVFICTLVALAMGFVASGVYRYKNPNVSQSMAVTLVLLPAMVQIIIMLVRGDIGVGIAVAGAFSLIRFRSIAGSAKDIGHIFFAMAVGFILGLGFVYLALAFMVIVGLASLLLTKGQYGRVPDDGRLLKIRIPENLDYEGLFEDIFEKYTTHCEMESLKTTQMGSLFELTYTVKMDEKASPKAFLDDLRVRNGNLSISLGRNKRVREEL